jgi:HAD superfamily phosphoserine phosphatase-like hydrolase
MATPCVFFDLDGTLVRWQWSHAWIVALANAGLIERVVLQRSEKALNAYRKRKGDFDDFVNEMISAFFQDKRMNGVRLSDVRFVSDRLAQESGDYVHVFTRELNLAAKELGYARAIITGSPAVAAKAFGDRHDIPLIMGTEFQNDGKTYTAGEIIECFTRKDEALERLAQAHDIDLGQSVAVGDSQSDAPMLKRVSWPVAFQPNLELEEIAEQYRWPVVTEKKHIRAYEWDDRNMMRETRLDCILPQRLAHALHERLRALQAYRR